MRRGLRDVEPGLRWEFATPIWERDNNWTNFDPSTNNAGQGDERKLSTAR